jgi:hypothetical protein
MDNSLHPFKGTADVSQKEYLKILHLTAKSSAEDVRRIAISARRKFEESGLDAQTVRALEWSLKQTNDAMDDREFLHFLLNGLDFETIENNRFDFR